MIVLGVVLLLVALAVILELSFGATARRRHARRLERDRPATLESGSSHLRDRG
jgi:hypothetical protein